MRSWRLIASGLVAVSIGLLGSGGTAASGTATKFHGPLRVSSVNPRYFTDDSGRAVYLTGTHIWNDLQDEGPASGVGTLPILDYNRYLQFLRDNGHNFMRMWMWEQPRYASWGGGNPDYYFDPIPYARSGVCCALDGGNKFDLTKYNPVFFQRLRDRVMAAGEQGIYVSVMLFEGWSIFAYNQDPWPGNPYNGPNNINGVDATHYNDQGGPSSHSHRPNPAVWPYQKAYIDHVIDTVGDLDNVLYEVSNEDPNPTEQGSQDLQWQNQVVDEVHTYEGGRGHERHPVGITFTYCDVGGCATNQQIADTHADWMSPAGPSHGSFEPHGKVVLWDTDHITGQGITDDQAWKAFLNGWNPISMDHFISFDPDCSVGYIDPEDGVVPLNSDWRSSCGDLAMRDTARYANRVDLLHMVSQPSACSTGYCLVHAAQEYLVYQPIPAAAFTITLAPGDYAVEWFDIKTHTTVRAPSVHGRNGEVTFQAPFDEPAVLLLQKGRR
jgi:Family of unknown function (DUF6298)